MPQAFRAAVATLILAWSGAAFAEANQVRFARQLGLGYLQFYVMQDKQMLEKAAGRAGLGAVTAIYVGMGTPTAITDALLSGNVDVVGIGLPAFLTMWDKTRGGMNVRGVMAMNRQPAYLTTRNPNIKSIRDFTDNDRIALPAVKVSVQAIMLQMIAEKTLGKFDAIDRLTVGMSHPDGTAAMMSGKLEITAHFTSAPFQYQQLENPAIRKVLSSYDATDGTAAMMSGKLEITAHFTSAPFQYQQLENPAIRKVLSSYDATDGTAAMMSGKLEITAHFTSAPFQY